MQGNMAVTCELLKRIVQCCGYYTEHYGVPVSGTKEEGNVVVMTDFLITIYMILALRGARYTGIIVGEEDLNDCEISENDFETFRAVVDFQVGLVREWAYNPNTIGNNYTTQAPYDFDDGEFRVLIDPIDGSKI